MPRYPMDTAERTVLTDISNLTAAFFVSGLTEEHIPKSPAWLDDSAEPLRTLRGYAEKLFKTDTATYAHSVRVANQSLHVAAAMPLTHGERAQLYVAAFFHDVGKLSVNRELLRRNGALTAEERLQIKNHPVEGWKMFLGMEGFAPVAQAIRHHHERIDGSGYPDRLSGGAIPLMSRIIAVADSFDAMASRPYSKHTSREDILGEIRRYAGSQFDMEIASEFVGGFPRFLQ